MSQQLATWLARINRKVGIVCGVGLLATCLFVLTDIVLRQFGASFGGADEISGYAMAITTAWGMSYAMSERAHVRIELLRSGFSGRWRLVLDLAVLAVLAAVVTFIAWKTWPVLSRSLQNNSHANTPLETTLWWVQLPWLAGWAWFAVSSWLLLFIGVGFFREGRLEDAESLVGAAIETEYRE